uniref:TIR domain-containing protein n=1 Tax=Neogobius melanostomus TaxID=47308 RepID=A0A8C6U7T1_9GOBI
MGRELLSRIPSDIPKTAVILNVSHNNINFIQQSYFSGLTELQILDLSNNQISHIEDASFSHLSSLTVLSLIGNKLMELTDHMFTGLSNLTVLNLTENQITFVSEFVFVPLTKLLQLRLRDNRLSSISDIVKVVSFCPLLKFLDLSNNPLSSIESEQFPFPLNITELDLSWTLLSRFSLHSDVFPHLQTLYFPFIFNDLQWDVSDQAFLRNLRTLDMSLTDFTNETYQLIFNVGRLDGALFNWACGIQTLQTLDLSFNGYLIVSDSLLLPCSNLTELHLLGNDLKDLAPSSLQMLTRLSMLNLGANSLTEKLFVQKTSILNLDDCFGKTLPNLLVLDAADNNIEELQRGVFSNMTCLKDLELQTKSVTEMLVYQETFVGLTDLRTLSMSPIFIFDPPSAGVGRYYVWIPVPELFQPLTVLQTLDLSENHLKSMDFLSEANLTQLQTLIIKTNDMSVINERVFEALPSLRYLDLSDNPFVCNCSNADFIDWVIRNRQVYVNGAYQYRCASLPSEQGALLLDSALVLLTLLLSFLHHFLRLHLLYGFYLLRAFLYHRQQRGRGCAEIYDAFVSYNVHDEEWVYRELLPELEGRQGWKLCLHHRDFEPGKAIMENIVDAIYSSRKTLCVISHQYLLSEWCSREIQMARCCSHTVSLVIGEVHLTHKRIKIRTYLSWSGARGHRGLFWERVRHALQSGAQLPDDPLPTDD